jgi:hypothetical protein
MELFVIYADLIFVYRLISIFDIEGGCCRCVAYLLIYCLYKKKEIKIGLKEKAESERRTNNKVQE